MREILFRGRTKDCKWVYGDLQQLCEIVVKFEDYRFRIVGQRGNEYTPLQKYVDFQKLDVVGNIYDNPELLKKENE